MHDRLRAPLLALTALAGLAAGAEGTILPATEQLRIRLEALETDPLHAGLTLGDRRFTGRFYARRDFHPAWRAPAMDELLEQIERAADHGLVPEDYHLQKLRELRGAGDAPIDLDLIATDALARLAYHLRFGKVDPARLDANWNLSRQLVQDPFAVLEHAIGESAIAALLERLAPAADYYRVLREGLARYRAIQAAGGWPAVSPGSTLKPGMRDGRVAELRRRLAESGELEDLVEDETLFDVTLTEAIEVFQRRHGLDADGLVGRQTLEALNIPVEARIDQIRVNLERARWSFRDIAAESDYLLINIAGFSLQLFRHGEPVWATRVQVGTRYRQTPVFRSTMQHIVFNPTWTVPPTILRRDLLPKLREDPAQLRERNMTVIDRDGNVVDPAGIDWAGIGPRSFPYMIRQEPGPQNALGRMKFIFPNPHFVFLHDTPSGELFKRADRAFSSGCIRVEDPLRLAVLLLDGSRWTQPEIEAVIAEGRTRTVPLRSPLTVLLLYATVVPDEQSGIVFLHDVYARDGRVLEELDAEFVFTPPEGWEALFGVDEPAPSPIGSST